MVERLVNIFTGEFDALESQNICFKPEPKHVRAIGVLCSADASLSIAFKNGTKQVIAEFEFSYRNEGLAKPPNKRILKLDEPLDDCVITGIVSNTKTTHYLDKRRTINVYLLMKEDEQ